MIHSSKQKLPKGRSYAFKTSFLEKAIKRDGIDVYISLDYWCVPLGGPIFRARYLLPNANVDYPRVMIAIKSVDSKERKKIVEKIEKDAMPKLIKWIKAVISLPDNSTQLNKSLFFEAKYLDEKLVLSSNLE